MRGLRVIAAALALALAVLGAHAEGERRVALVIGNDDYTILRPKLENAARDAETMGRALKDAGFSDVSVATNVKRRELYQLIDAFGAKIAATPDTVGLFYYAGHGVQANGINYLVPVDADVESEQDLEAEAVDVGKVLHAMAEARNRFNIVILDACRDNPLPKSRSLSRGLAKMDAPSGTFIAYAAAPGHEAADGAKGENGIFTGAFAETMAEDRAPIEEMFKHVIAKVSARTGGKQEPWMETSYQGDFYFRAPAPAVATQPPPAPAPAFDARQIELTYWDSIKASKDPADFEAYLAQYPKGSFAALARNRIAYLKRTEEPPAPAPQGKVAVVTPPPAPAQPAAANLPGLLFGEPIERVFPATRYDYNTMPVATEYKTDDVRYLTAKIASYAPWRNYLSENGCMSPESYLVFMFTRRNLFRVSVRLVEDQQCTDYRRAVALLRTLRSPGVAVTVHETKPYTVVEFIRPGMANSDGDLWPF